MTIHDAKERPRLALTLDEDLGQPAGRLLDDKGNQRLTLTLDTDGGDVQFRVDGKVIDFQGGEQ